MSIVIKPPFTEETARAKVKMAQDAWNTRDPAKVAMAYTENSQWHNRTEFFEGRATNQEFLTRKWANELDYTLMKELWCYQGNRISVRFEYDRVAGAMPACQRSRCGRTATSTGNLMKKPALCADTI